jgi:hypothetical protein
MALFRQVHTEFWQDNFVVELTPEDRYFYLYLITNSRVSQCGIYSFSRKFAAVETGYSSETIDKLLERFVGYGKILYNAEKNEIMILNWYKYNNITNHKNIRTCINKELKKVKTQGFIEKFYELCTELDGSSSERNSENRNQDITKMSRAFKLLAKELDITIVLLSQLSRAPELREDHRPMMSDLRESGAIEQDADIVMFVYRDYYYNPQGEKEKELEIIIGKNRNGEVGTVKLHWDGALQRLE